jgi:menaquinone-9 beta-reductase
VEEQNMADYSSLPVAVVGAGPAGCAAAIALGQAGEVVTLFERGQPGKDKTCGDAYSATATSLLAAYGVDAARLAALGGLPYQDMELRGHQGHVWRLHAAGATGQGPGWLIRRAIMDQQLRDLAAAWASLRYGCLVANVVSEPGRPLLLSLQTADDDRSAMFACRGLILACGAASPLPRNWGITGEPRISASVSAYADPAPAGPRGGPPVRLPVFEFKPCCRPGYAWTFPLADGQINFGVCTLAKPAGQPLTRLALEHAQAYGLQAQDRLRGAREATWSGLGRRWHHLAGILSCGDAAGLADPDTGEGVAAALLSGQQAGKALARYLDDARLCHLEDYSQWVRQYFGDSYRPGPFRQVWAALARGE